MIARKIEQIFTRFFWKGKSEVAATGAKIAWKHICLPFKEGGLGIKRVHDWNCAQQMYLIWLFIDNPSTPSFWAIASRITVFGQLPHQLLHLLPPGIENSSLFFVLKFQLLFLIIGNRETTLFWQDP